MMTFSPPDPQRRRGATEFLWRQERVTRQLGDDGDAIAGRRRLVAAEPSH